MALYNIPGVYAEIQDGGLRISKPVLQPKVTVLGITNSTQVDLLDPYVLRRYEDINLFDNSDGTPSEMTRVMSEAFDAGADHVEGVIIATGTGIDADARYTALETAYTNLLNTDIDIVVPCGVAIDTVVSNDGAGNARNFGHQLANFCYQSTVNHNTAIGFIGVEPPVATTGTPTLTQLENWVTALTNFDTSALSGRDFSIYDGVTDADGDDVPDNYAFYATTDGIIPVGNPPAQDPNVVFDALQNPVDIGAYINVIAAHVRSAGSLARRVNPTLGWYIHNGAGAYAGLTASLPARRAPTNKVLPYASPTRNMSLSQISSLSTARFPTVWVKPSGNKLSDAMTGAYNISTWARSDFVRLSTVRIVHDAINLIRGVSDPFIGEPANPVNMNALEAAVDEALSGMVKEGSLNDYAFSVVATATMRILGQVLIDVKLDIAHEIREITIRVALVPPGSLG